MPGNQFHPSTRMPASRTWISYIGDAAVYPVMAAGYVVSALNLHDSLNIVVVEAIVGLMILIRMTGFNALVKFSTAMTIITLVPALIYVGYLVPHVDSDLWFDTVGKQNCSLAPEPGFHKPHVECAPVPVEWGQLLPFVMWLWGGFFSMSTLAGQVKNPGRNIPLATMVLIPIVLANIVLPLAFSLPIDRQQKAYVSGHYTHLAGIVAGNWLKITFSVAAFISLVGTCNSAVIVSDEALQSFFTRHRPKFFAKQRKSKSWLMRWLFDTHERIAPFFVLFNGAILGMAAWLPYNLLISSSMVLANVTLVLVYGAYVLMKWKEPDATWLYKFGWKGAILLSMFPTAFTLAMVYFAMFDYPTTMGIPYINLISTVVIIGFGFGAQFGVKLIAKHNKAVYDFIYLDSDEVPDEVSSLVKESKIPTNYGGINDHAF